MLRIISSLLLSVILLGLASCGLGGSGGSIYSDLIIESDNDAPDVGESAQLTAFLLTVDQKKEPANDRVTWTISDESVASLSYLHNVTILTKGKVTVSASFLDLESSISFENDLDVAKIELIRATDADISPGDEFNISVIASTPDGTTKDITKDVVFDVSTPAVASQIATGVFKANGIGSTVIKASYLDHSAEITISVGEKKNSTSKLVRLEFVELEDVLEIGQTITPVVEAVYNDDSRVNVSSDVSWKVTQNSFSLNNDALKALNEGTALVQAAYQGVSANSTIKIVDPRKLYVRSDTNDEITLQWKESRIPATRIYWNTVGGVNGASAYFDVTGKSSFSHTGVNRYTKYYYRLAQVIDGVPVLGDEIMVQPRLNEWYLVDRPEWSISDQSVLVLGDMLIELGGYQYDKVAAAYVYSDHVGRKNLKTQAYETKASMPMPRSNMAACTDGVYVYTFGGIAIVDGVDDYYTDYNYRYDPKLDEWLTTLKVVPYTANGQNCHYKDGFIYVFGGNTDTGHSNEVYAYNIELDSWTVKSSMTNARRDFSSSLIGNVIYVIGGANDSGLLAGVETYNILTDTWIAEDDLPFGIAFHAASALGDKIYVTGGGVTFDGVVYSSTQMYIFDTRTKKWERNSSSIFWRNDAASYVYGNYIYVYGGSDPSLTAVKLTEMFDTNTNDWFPKTPMPFKSALFATAAIDSKIYLFGGDRLPASDSVDEFDLKTNSWRENIGQMSQAVFGLEAVAVENEIYTFGGMLDVNNPISQTKKYDPIANTWTYLSSSPVSSNFSGMAVSGKVVYKMGGNTSSNRAFSYNTVLDRWTTLPNLPTSRSAPMSVTLGNYVYVIGGTNSNGVTDVVERFNMKLNSWETVEPLQNKRYAASSAVINGKIYVFGGYADQTLKTVEVFDPFTESWSSGPDMPFARSITKGHLVDGAYYLIGGTPANSNTPYSTMEIFR